MEHNTIVIAFILHLNIISLFQNSFCDFEMLVEYIQRVFRLNEMLYHTLFPEMCISLSYHILCILISGILFLAQNYSRLLSID